MVEITSDLILQRAEIPVSEIDNDQVFFNHETGTFFGANAVGAEIWGVLETPQSFSAVCDLLLEKYDVDRATCESDVRAFIGDMLQGGVLIAASSSAT